MLGGVGRRHGATVAVAVAVALAASAAPASAATHMGPVLEGLTPSFGVPDNSQTVGILDAAGVSAAAPVTGVLTRIRMKRGAHSASSASQFAYRIFSGTTPNLKARPATPSGLDDVVFAVRSSAPATIETYFPVDASGEPVGVPITAGEYLGLWVDLNRYAMSDSIAGSQYVRGAGDPLGSTNAYSPFSTFRLLVDGLIEPDADADKYGDESQDACPGDATRHTLPCTADLALTMTAGAATVTVGGDLTYTLTVENLSDSPASNVTITDALPGSVTLTSTSATQGACGGGGTVICAIGTLGAKSKATATLTVRPGTAGSLANTASVSSASDPTAANDSAGATTTVSEPPAIQSPDVTAPVISAAKAQPKRFKARGVTTFSFVLSEPAGVTIAVERATTGRRAGKACVALTKSNRKAKRCRRWITVSRLKQPVAAGATTRAWPAARKLARRGSYRVTLGASDAAGNAAATRRFTFTVTKR